MQKPKVSVIMSVYNTQRYIAKAVESILDQTFKDFEFIIIDDGSTDNSLRILKKYALKDKRLKIISRANTGLAAALNEGLEIAKGDYIARMDADDISMLDRFEKQVRYLEEHKECVAVGSKILVIDPNDMPLMYFSCKQNHEGIDKDHMDGKGGALSHPTAMIRKEALLKIGGYRNEFKYVEDFDLFLRLAEIGKLSNLPDVLLKYRMHGKKIGHLKRRTQVENCNLVLKEAYNRRKLSKKNIPFLEQEEIRTTKDLYTTWAWWALNGRNIKTARKYALLTFLRSPFSSETWKLIFCCLRGF